MIPHPEMFERGSGGVPYDPDEPILVPWADVVAAINAALALRTVLTDRGVDLDATKLNVGGQVREWLTTALDIGDRPTPMTLDSREAAVEWVESLVQRLKGCLPR